MKTKFLFFVILSFELCAEIAQAQQWTFGPKAYQGLTISRTTNSQTQINGINVTTDDYGDAIGNALSVFVRHDRPRWYAQAEAARGKYSSANVEVSGSGGTSVLYPSATRTDARLIVGVKPLPWLRLSVGVVGVRNNWNRFDYEAESRSYEVLGQRYPGQRDYYQRQVDLARVAGAK